MKTKEIIINKKAYEIENTFSKFSHYTNTPFGTVKIDKKQNQWYISSIVGNGSRYAIHLKWQCQVDDGKMILERKFTLGMIVQLCFCVFFSCFSLFLLGGFIIKTVRDIFHGGNFEVIPFAAVILICFICALFWWLFHFCFIKKANQVLTGLTSVWR